MVDRGGNGVVGRGLWWHGGSGAEFGGFAVVIDDGVGLGLLLWVAAFFFFFLGLWC